MNPRKYLLLCIVICLETYNLVIRVFREQLTWSLNLLIVYVDEMEIACIILCIVPCYLIYA